MKKRIINNILFLAIILSFNSCQSFFFDEKLELKEAVWTYDNQLEFSFKIEDTTKIYNIYLETVHSTEYPNQNLYSRINVKFPDGTERKQQVSLEFADSKGEWVGKCNSKSCTRRIPFMPNAVFDQAGNYTMKFEQFTRNEKIDGINSIRLIIEKTDLNRGESGINSSKNKQKVS